MKKLLKQLKRILRREAKITPGTITDVELMRMLGRDDPLILEIGCHDGGHTEWFLELFPRAEIHCFEPDPRPIKTFQERLDTNRVALHQLAISDQDKDEVVFHMSNGVPPNMSHEDFPEGWDHSGSIRRPNRNMKALSWLSFDHTIKVSTKKLDSWCKENGITDRTIDFIWADVQGAEIDLVRGATETLRRTRYFFTEYSNRELYDGQVNLKTLLRHLPDFELVYRYAEDVLVMNKQIAKADPATVAA